jgi:hypothetical protein
MSTKVSTYDTIATSQHWKRLIEQLNGRDLLPHRLRVDAQIFLARALAMYRTDALYADEAKAVRELMVCWIEQLLTAQDITRLPTFRKHLKVLLPQLTDELEHWLRQALLSQQIGYPLTNAHMNALFLEAFNEVQHVQ